MNDILVGIRRTRSSKATADEMERRGREGLPDHANSDRYITVNVVNIAAQH